MTGVLCVWIYATCFPDIDYSDCLCDDCWNIFFAECGELLLAMDFLLLSSIHGYLRVLVFHILLLCQDQNVWILPDQLLFWIHRHVLPRFRNSMWYISLSLSLFFLGILDRTEQVVLCLTCIGLGLYS